MTGNWEARMSDIAELRDELRCFAEARDWDQFHSPKNLAMAVAGEVGELVSELQWLSEEQSVELNEEKLAAINET